MSKDKLKGPDTKPRYYNAPACDYSVQDCDSGGKYQELPTVGAFVEVTKGTRLQRLHERDYCKVVHEKKPNIEDALGSIIKDTNGPPFENISQPKRIL